MDLFLETSNRDDGEKSIFYWRNIFWILKKLDPVYKESLNNVEKMEKLLK